MPWVKCFSCDYLEIPNKGVAICKRFNKKYLHFKIDNNFWCYKRKEAGNE
jgi:hypothetical protein